MKPDKGSERIVSQSCPYDGNRRVNDCDMKDAGVSKNQIGNGSVAFFTGNNKEAQETYHAHNIRTHEIILPKSFHGIRKAWYDTTTMYITAYILLYYRLMTCNFKFVKNTSSAEKTKH